MIKSLMNLTKNDYAMVASPYKTSERHFEQLRKLRSIRDDIDVALGYCTGNLEVLKCVQRSTDSRPFDSDLPTHTCAGNLVQSHVRSFKLLKDRASNTIHLVSSDPTTGAAMRILKSIPLKTYLLISSTHLQISITLDVHNQDQAATLNREMKLLAHETSEVTKKLAKMTENSAREGGIIRVITIVSAIYLPGSFVTVSWTLPKSAHCRPGAGKSEGKL